MRVVDINTLQLIQNQIMSSRKRMQDASEVVDSGKKINNLGDDPTALQRMVRHDSEQMDNSQYERNLHHLDAKYKTYETLSEQVYLALSSFKSTMVMASNPHNDSDARTQVQSEIQQLREQLLSIANTRSEDQAIFSGARTDSDAYAADGIYLGDDVILENEIMPEMKMDANITGQTLFGGEGMTDGVNIFQLLNTLEDELVGDTQTAVGDHLDEIDQAIEQAIHVQMEVGTQLSRIEVSVNTLERLDANLAEKRQFFEDADYVTAITDFQTSQTVLESVMSVNSRMLNVSLLNFIR